MRLPAKKRKNPQRRLFHADRPINSKGEARWAAGEFFEEAIAEVSGGTRLRTDSRADICPDIQFDATTFAESKSVGPNGSVIFYECRYLKDRDFMQQTGHTLLYWFWRHDFPVCQATSYDHLRDGLAGAVRSLVVVAADVLADAVKDRPTRVVNTAYTASGVKLGYGDPSKGYGVGWALRYSFFRERCHKLPVVLNPTIYGMHVMRNVPVYVSRPDLEELVFPRKTQQTITFRD